MASGSLPAASAAAAAANPASSSSSTPQRRPCARAVAFRPSHEPKVPLFSSKACGLKFGAQRSCAVVVKSQLTEVVGGHSNASIAADRKPDVSTGDGATLDAKEAAASPVSKEAVSEFMNQVADLVKLVDSRDIVELQLKQQGCEVVIRKKEALPQPSLPAPVVMTQPHGPPSVFPPQFLPPAAPAALAPAVASAPQAPPTTPPAATAKSAKSSLPPLKSPMAGTLYISPGPGQPPFVKVGDKVNKGQVLCIIEAMKLMNEIEADQGGTLVEILVDDAKPVAIDQPLFVIEP